MTHYYKYILVSLLVFLSNHIHFSQSAGDFNQLTSKDGLSQNSVYSIVQDNNGFMWFGTKDGLNKYDGYNLDVYYSDPSNPNSLYSNEISSLVLWQDSILYIGTRGGVNKLILKNEKFQRLNIPAKNNLNQIDAHSMIIDSRANLWISSMNNLIRYSTIDGEIKYFAFDKAITEYNSIYEDYNGNIWIATLGGVYNWDPESDDFNVVEIKSQALGVSAKTIFNYDSSSVMVAKQDHVYLYNPGARSTNDINNLLQNHSVTLKGIRQIITDGNKTFVMGSGGFGIYFINPSLNLFRKIYFTEDQGVGKNNIMFVYFDSQKNLWAGTNGAGALYWNKNRKSFNLISSENYKLNNRSIRSIYKDENYLWVGGYDGFEQIDVSKISSGVQSSLIPISVYTRATVRVIKPDPADKNLLWLGIEGGEIKVFNKTTKKIVNNNYPFIEKFNQSFRSVYDLLFTAEGELLIATQSGLIKTVNKLKNIIKIDKHPQLTEAIIYNIYQDKFSNYWLSTANKGIIYTDNNFSSIKIFNNQPHNIKSLSSNTAFSSIEDNIGNIWVGTNSGLNMLNPESGEIVRYNTIDGLPNNTIYSVMFDDDNNLWMSTNNGLAKYDVVNNAFSSFGPEYNLQDKEYNVGAFHKAADGEMFFGGIRGINSFYPKNMKRDVPFPRVQLTDFSIYNYPVKIDEQIDGDVILTKILSETDVLDLNYDQNTIAIEYAALEYFENSTIMYSYILENFDEQWNDVGNRRIASYSKLPPGEYIFKVRSTNIEGLWNPQSKSIAINILPPLWRTWYSFTVYIIVTILLVMIIIYFNQQRFLAKQKELEKEKEISEKLRGVDKLKNNFLAQISHEVRTPINSILSFSSLIETEVRDDLDEDMKFGFDSINTSGKRIIRTVDLILNLSQVQTGTYVPDETLMDLSFDILEQIVTEHNILAKNKGLQLTLKNESRNSTISGDNYSTTQIFANLTENAIKYTEEGKIEIRIYNENDQTVCVDVSDTGIGISEEFVPMLFDSFTQESQGYNRAFEGNGLGLALVKKYCELNKAEIFVKSIKGSGTTFTVKFPSA